MDLTANIPSDAIRTGSFQYMMPTVRHSLFRNGKVLTRRDRDGSDAGRQGLELEPRQMPVRDARRLGPAAQRTLARNGFELHARPPANAELDFFDHGQVVRDYYPHCAEIVRQASGAECVVAFDHNVRSGRRQAKPAAD